MAEDTRYQGSELVDPDEGTETRVEISCAALLVQF